MHIEPGIVNGTKIVLSYGTAAAVLTAAAWLTRAAIRRDGRAALLGRASLATLWTFCCFEVLPHYPVGVSEVHLILGSTLYLLFGPAASAIGLASGLLLQGWFFAPGDLPQYGMNVTTLLAPLFAVHALAQRINASGAPYIELAYAQVFKLSLAYQAGIVAWVGFWALYGWGASLANLAEIASFASAYLLVVIIEPLIDLGLLAIAKKLPVLGKTRWLEQRIYVGQA